ncbi:MAG: prepilin-type N-terminal cleavage/methylation domain-containing protein [Rubrivivax sp.]|nr:prepilin-type N-terminal cleavage/methylation domain-containing protein [Rubrivivax sp.]
MLTPAWLGCPRTRQRGLSLVEMMVGVAIGLFIVAGAAMLAGTQLGENRRLLLETQVQQDLRAAADIITRELRRAGYDATPHWSAWSAQSALVQPIPNNRIGLQVPGQDSDVVTYTYDRPGVAPSFFGYRLVNGAIRQRIGATAQDLTDINTLKVTAFTVERADLPAIQLACPRLCANGTQNCWPTLTITDATVTITGHALSEPNLSRTVISRIRLRNDGVKFNVSPTQVCP